MDRFTLAASYVYDGTGARHESAAVVIENGRVAALEDHVDLREETEHAVADFSGFTLIPGLIDNHTHMTLPGDGTAAEDAVAQGEARLLLKSADNARRALKSGVTSARENGAPGLTAFALRAAIAEGSIPGPRLFVSGRPVTVTGGHCWMFGGEADGVEGVRHAVRRLVRDGADFIKVMATGGTTRGSLPYRAAFHAEELAAVVQAAQQLERQVVVHATSTEGIVGALSAGVDYITHCAFYEPDGTYLFRDDVAREIADRGVWVNPTLHIHRTKVRRLERLAEERPLSLEEIADLDRLRTRYAERCDNFFRLSQAGVRFAAGSDAAWGLFPMGQFAQEMDAMVEAGLPRKQALLSATADSARSMRVDREIGSLEVGKVADVVVIDGDPEQDILALGRVVAVFQAGVRVDA